MTFRTYIQQEERNRTNDKGKRDKAEITEYMKRNIEKSKHPVSDNAEKYMKRNNEITQLVGSNSAQIGARHRKRSNFERGVVHGNPRLLHEHNLARLRGGGGGGGGEEESVGVGVSGA